MKRLASILAALGLCFSTPATAAIGVTQIASTAQNAGNVTTFYLPTTADAPSGSEIIGGIGLKASVSSLAISGDTSGACSSYTLNAIQQWNTTANYTTFQCLLAADLPPPCTITASFATNTLTVTAVSGSGFCTSSAVLASGLSVSGTSVTAQTVLSGSCTLTGGAGTCTTLNNAGSHAGETITLSSTITFTWTGSTTVVGGAVDATGLSSTPLDKTGTAVKSASATSNTVTGVTLSVANELLIGLNPIAGTYSAFAANGSWTVLTSPAISANMNMPWAYQIVSSTAGPSFAPSWTTALPTGADFWTYEQAAVVSPARRGPLLGVGP